MAVNDLVLSDNEDYLSIYPNPSSGTITVIASIGSQVHIEINDLSGRRVQYMTADKIQRKEFDISQLPAGTYTVRVVGRNDVMTKKLVVTK